MGISADRFEIRFENVSVADAGKLASRFCDDIATRALDMKASVQKDDPTNQDLGTTIVLILGTQAAMKIAEGIAAYLKRDRATITISRDGKVVAKNVSGNDAARIAEALSNK